MLRRTPLPRGRIPLRRTRLRARSKPKPPSVLHPEKPLRLRGQDMTELRLHMFQRSAGYCERIKDGKRCARPIQWHTFELSHYPKSRAHGGPDTPDNTQAWCKPCHREHTGEPQWSGGKA